MANSMNSDLIKKLMALYETDEVARKFFDMCAGRERTSSETKIDRLEHKLGVPRWEAVALARKLSDLGLGRFVVGRRQSPSRMEWIYSLPSLGAVARGTGDQLVEVEPDAAHEEGDSHSLGSSSEEKSSMVEHTYMLRPESLITLRLPADLSVKEAQRLAAFVQSLPFDA